MQPKQLRVNHRLTIRQYDSDHVEVSIMTWNNGVEEFHATMLDGGDAARIAAFLAPEGE